MHAFTVTIFVCRYHAHNPYSFVALCLPQEISFWDIIFVWRDFLLNMYTADTTKNPKTSLYGHILKNVISFKPKPCLSEHGAQKYSSVDLCSLRQCTSFSSWVWICFSTLILQRKCVSLSSPSPSLLWEDLSPTIHQSFNPWQSSMCMSVSLHWFKVCWMEVAQQIH